MSTERRSRRITVPELRARKGGEPLVCLTAYDALRRHSYWIAHCDLLLVGDSVGMVVHGLPRPRCRVTLEMMIAHGRRHAPRQRQRLIVIDMPFGSYRGRQEPPTRLPPRVMKETGAPGVKLESGRDDGGNHRLSRPAAAFPSWAIRPEPQAVLTDGASRPREAPTRSGCGVMAEAEATADAGAFSIVVEGVAEGLARDITDRVDKPTIGIGASSACDGQILVVDDLIGMFKT